MPYGTCRKGHPMVPSNRLKHGNGYICAMCRRAWDRERKQRQKAEVQS